MIKPLSMIELPWPPPKKKLYGMVRHGQAYRQKPYKDYITGAHAIFQHAKLKTFEGDVLLKVTFYKPCKGGRLDDYYDLVIDTITCNKEAMIHQGRRLYFANRETGLIVNRKQIKKFYTTQTIDRTDPRIRIELYDSTKHEGVIRAK